MRKLDLSVEKQHLLDNQRLKIPVSGVFRQNNGIYFHFKSRLYISSVFQIILIVTLCDAGNLIFAGYLFIFFIFFIFLFFLSTQWNNSPIMYLFEVWHRFITMWTLTCNKTRNIIIDRNKKSINNLNNYNS